jgi:hypothetical protein
MIIGVFKKIIMASLLLLPAVIQVAWAADKGVVSINFETVEFRSTPADAKDNALFWGLVKDKPADLKMEDTLFYIRVDLDGDGSFDLLGTLSANGYYCGHQGAECALFAVVKGRLIKSICNAPMYETIDIFQTRTNGLRDIGWKNGCLLRYDGKATYDAKN